MALSFSHSLKVMLMVRTCMRNTNYIKLEYHSLRGTYRSLNSSPKCFNLVCWKCGKERNENIFCANCQMIQQPPELKNYFNILGINEKYDIDQTELRNKFLQLQSVIHPDKFSNRTDEEKQIAEGYSSLLNKAYSYLQTPLKRAEYLLKLKGETINEPDTIDEPEFLMTMMTLNEEVDAAKNNADNLISLNNKNKMELEKLTKLIDESFRTNELMAVKKYIIKMKYFTSLSNRINHYLREMGVTN